MGYRNFKKPVLAVTASCFVISLVLFAIAVVAAPPFNSLHSSVAYAQDAGDGSTGGDGSGSVGNCSNPGNPGNCGCPGAGAGGGNDGGSGRGGAGGTAGQISLPGNCYSVYVPQHGQYSESYETQCTSVTSVTNHSCPTGDSGTYPYCVAPSCPTGDYGTYPDCIVPTCPASYPGTYPDCACPVGDSGTYPSCVAASGHPELDLQINGSNLSVTTGPGDPFYFTWTSHDVTDCTPSMVSSVDPWWTNGAGVERGGYLPISYGSAGNYSSTGLAHTLSADGVYTYAERCESAATDLPYESVPVTVSVACPAGYANEGGQCVPTGSCISHSECDASGNIVNSCTDAIITPASACTYGCFGGACVAAPLPQVTQKLTAAPELVRSGSSTVVSWAVSNVTSCNVSSTNNDDPWTCAGAACNDVASNTHTSIGITAQTIYTLSCVPLPGAVNADGSPYVWQNETATVNVVPKYQEQ